MIAEEILTALRRLKVETGSLVCMGCGREHDCKYSPCNRRNVGEDEFCSYGQPKEGAE